jgi:hypothetical protein
MYYAYVEINGAFVLWNKGKNYDKLSVRFEKFRMENFEKHQIWIGGFIQSFAG